MYIGFFTEAIDLRDSVFLDAAIMLQPEIKKMPLKTGRLP